MLQTIRRLTTIFLFALLYIGIQSCSSHPTGTEDSIVKSANDNRQYHSFTLPNQLKVLVISDPDTDKADRVGAAMLGMGKLNISALEKAYNGAE